MHLDASSFHVHGQYEPEPRRHDVLGQEEMPSISITYGYSRAHRPDLKQFVVDLMSTSDADVPLYFRAADGNTRFPEKPPGCQCPKLHLMGSFSMLVSNGYFAAGYLPCDTPYNHPFAGLPFAFW